MFYENLSAREQGALLCLANEVVRADGLITPEEMAHIQKLLKNVGSDVAPHTEEESYRIMAQASTGTKKGMYIELLSLALSDGVYDDKERQCMKKLQGHFALSDDFAEQSVEWLLKYIDVVRQGQKLTAEEGKKWTT